MLFNQLHVNIFWVWRSPPAGDICGLMSLFSLLFWVPMCPHTLSIKGFLPFFHPCCCPCNKTSHALHHFSVLQAMKSWAGAWEWGYIFYLLLTSEWRVITGIQSDLSMVTSWSCVSPHPAGPTEPHQWWALVQSQHYPRDWPTRGPSTHPKERNETRR